jgi:hypothetical protein
MEISIKEACHENWSNMTPNEQGAFCGKCVKNVIDFTTKSLEEIKEFFTGREQQNICGRFQDKQLSALSFDAFFERFRNFEFTKRFAVILFFTFGLGLFDPSTAAAQSDSLAKCDTTIQALEKVEYGKAISYTATPFPHIETITIMGGISSIQDPQNFDWAPVHMAQPVWFKEPEKKAPVRPAPLKRKPVDRRRD